MKFYINSVVLIFTISILFFGLDSLAISLSVDPWQTVFKLSLEDRYYCFRGQEGIGAIGGIQVDDKKSRFWTCDGIDKCFDVPTCWGVLYKKDNRHYIQITDDSVWAIQVKNNISKWSRLGEFNFKGDSPVEPLLYYDIRSNKVIWTAYRGNLGTTRNSLYIWDLDKKTTVGPIDVGIGREGASAAIPDIENNNIIVASVSPVNSCVFLKSYDLKGKPKKEFLGINRQLQEVGACLEYYDPLSWRNIFNFGLFESKEIALTFNRFISKINGKNSFVTIFFDFKNDKISKFNIVEEVGKCTRSFGSIYTMLYSNTNYSADLGYRIIGRTIFKDIDSPPYPSQACTWKDENTLNCSREGHNEGEYYLNEFKINKDSLSMQQHGSFYLHVEKNYKNQPEFYEECHSLPE